jgi:hypothetical protein
MRTEIIHSYKTGFILSEQELRRIAQSCQESATKIGVDDRLRIYTKLKDGSLVEYNTIDDLLSSENGGQKSVVRLVLSCDDGHEEPRSYVTVEFYDAFEDQASWNSIKRSVVGESRDAVFVSAADLDDRIKKIQITSWSYIIGRPYILAVAMIVGMISSFWFIGYFAPSNSAAIVDQLQTYYDSGRIKDPIQAIIELERLKSDRSMWPFYLFPIPLLVAVAVVWSLQYLVPNFTRSYVFYWGDAVARFDKTRGIIKVFWTTIVLGLLVSIFAGWMLQLFLP